MTAICRCCEWTESDELMPSHCPVCDGRMEELSWVEAINRPPAPIFAESARIPVLA